MKAPLILTFVLGVCANLAAQTIPKGDIVVDVQSFATLPTSDNGQFARANVLRPSPDGRIFVNDQRGPLYTVSADGATVTPYLDLSSATPLLFDNGERGFQSFAFHPDFTVVGAAGYGKFYTMGSQSDTTATPNFSPGVSDASRDHDEVLNEWTVADPAAATFVAADAAHPYREVLRIARPASNHNAGYISFNPTAAVGASEHGYLYIGTGDSGGEGDPLGLVQMPDKIYGAILRIDPLGAGGQQYQVPPDNPYTSNSAFLPEVYARGFRNPQRFIWDAANGRMFISDIGQGRVEEIDLGQSGANYGWNLREGDYTYNQDNSAGAYVRGDNSGFTYPVAEYLHFGSIGNAVSVGPVVRSGIAALNGRLLFSDFPTGTPYTIDADSATSTGAPATITELRLRQGGVEMSFLDMIHAVNSGATRADLRYGEDAAGDVYLLDKQDGVIRELTPDPVVSPPPVNTIVSATVNVAKLSRASGEKAKVTLTRTGDASAVLRVNFALTGSAENGRDYASRPLFRDIAAGSSMAVVKIVPLTGGFDGKVKLTLEAGDGYGVNATARKVKIKLTD